jgi:hypothetical protein
LLREFYARVAGDVRLDLREVEEQSEREQVQLHRSRLVRLSELRDPSGDLVDRDRLRVRLPNVFAAFRIAVR